MARPSELLASAMKLSIEERATLAARLLESLDDREIDAADDVERAWAIEVARRIDDLKSGRVAALDGRCAIEEARKALGSS